jgi:putative flippase GtrA
LAVVFGIAIGIIFNYAGNSLWTFRKEIKKPLTNGEKNEKE